MSSNGVTLFCISEETRCFSVGVWSLISSNELEVSILSSLNFAIIMSPPSITCSCIPNSAEHDRVLSKSSFQIALLSSSLSLASKNLSPYGSSQEKLVVDRGCNWIQDSSPNPDCRMVSALSDVLFSILLQAMLASVPKNHTSISVRDLDTHMTKYWIYQEKPTTLAIFFWGKGWQL